MTKPPTGRVLKILLLEDSADDVTLVEWELKKAGLAYRAHVTSSASDFEQALAEFRPDVILTDHSLPGFNSIEAFRIYKEHEQRAGVSIPFILVTGNVNEEFAIQSLKAGVDDYILKDRLKRLPMAIESALAKCKLANEHRKYVQQVIAKEALMSEAEHLAGFGSWEADLRAGKYTWSDATYAIYGFGPGEIEPDYEKFLSLVHPEDRERLVALLTHLRQREDSGEYDFRIVTRRGEIKHVACRVKIHRDEAGVPVRLVGFNLDITHRKRAEEALKREGQKLEQAYRTARIGGWELDLPTNELSWTPITRELHEVEAGFQPTVRSGILFYKEGPSRTAISAALHRCIEKGIPWDLELQIVTAKGNERWVRAMGEAEMKEGKCVRLYGTFQDIHERKKAEELSKQVYEEKIKILESIGDGFFAVDRDWTVTYWNNMAERHLGMPREKMLGKNLWAVYQDAIPTAFYEQYHIAMEKSMAVHFEEYYVPLSIWFEVNVYPSPTGLSIYFKDITERKKHLSALEHQYKQLREIARIQSHEVRAPLARLMGLVNLINEGLNEEAELPVILERIGISAAELDLLLREIVKQTLPLESERDTLAGVSSE